MSRQTRRRWASLHRTACAPNMPTRTWAWHSDGRRLRFEALEDRRLLALVTVSNSLDLVNGNTTSITSLIATPGGDGISLREAIQAANATAGADEVRFAAALSGALITLGGTELAISEALTIDARPLGANVTIDAGLTSRIFNITAITGDYTFSGLVLNRGRTTAAGSAGGGGAIRSLTRSSLTLIESTVSGSSTTGISAYGGGIFAYSAVTLTQSTVSGNSTTIRDADGGGIWNFGPLMLSQSTVSGNSTAGNSAAGGGIWNYGSVTLNQSTVSGNSTAGSSSYGGGIFATLSAVTLTNSTVSGNRTTGPDADGGGIFGGGAVTITQSTVTVNQATHATALGGGVFQSNLPSNFPFSIAGSILAGNTAGGGGADLFKDPQSTLTVNYSLVGTGISLDPDSGGNNIVTNAPQLDPLADNGGPTQTHALQFGSPAIDAGDPSIASPVFDQRGAPFSRGFGGRIDIGAYERQTLPAVMFVVTTAADELNYANGDVSLREAINSANGSVGANTVTFAAALSGATITLGGTELAIAEAVTIDARPLAANVTINANQQSRIFNITAEAGDFTLGGLTLTGGRTTVDGSAGWGGAIRSLSTGNLILDESAVSGNSTSGHSAYGGGIFAKSAVTLTQSTIGGNSTSGVRAFGGGICVSGAVTLTQSTVSGNNSTGLVGAGGGIWSARTVTLAQSTVSGNSIAGMNAYGGGGIYALSVTLTQSTVSGNSTVGSGADGGGIFAKVSVTLTQSTISGNSADGFGGGVYAFGGELTVTQSTVTDNRAGYNGGGLCTFSGFPLSISGSIVAGNTAGNLAADISNPFYSTVNYSLIGNTIGSGMTSTGVGNVLHVSPQIGPLANNGGPTQTHALLAGSPAINVGDPGVVFSAMEFDQRGTPYVRVAGGRIDMGAVELQTAAPSGNFDGDSDVDGFDFLAWQRGFGLSGVSATRANGNADGDTDVDGVDFGFWKTQFGGAGVVAAATPAAAADMVFAGDYAALICAAGDWREALVAAAAAVSRSAQGPATRTRS